MKRIAALALGGLLAAPAFAGGPVVVAEEPMVAPAPVAMAPMVDWTGFYVGGQLGYGKVDVAGFEADVDGNGAIGGVHAGYRFDLGRAVLGTELAYDISNIDVGVGDTDVAELDNVLRLKFMAGGKVAERGLLYATAGAARAKVSTFGDSETDNGWFYGVGMDWMMNDRWSVGAELLRHEFNDFDDVDGLDIDANTLQVRASFRF